MKTVLLTVDALRADHLSQYGYHRETMPVVERLCDAGVRFDAAFANGTNTGVSLPSLLTSRYFGVDAAKNGPNVATAISETGTTTAGFHSNTLFSNYVENVEGFDHFEAFEQVSEASEKDKSLTERSYDRLIDILRPIVEGLGIRPAAEAIQELVFPSSLIHELSVYVDAATLTDEVLKWIEKHADEDFFVWVHYMDPHRPYGIDLYEPFYCDPVNNDDIRNLMSKAGVHPDTLTPTEQRLMIDLYDSDIRYTSAHIERLLDGLENLGIWNETGLVFTADHGEEFGEHGCYFHRNRPYDELIHVPLVVKQPDIPGGDIVEEQRELLDIAPTLCQWHNAEIPEQFRGKPLFTGADRRVIATGSFIEQGHVVSGRWNDWKYISVENGETELFDLHADPDERQNVAEDHDEAVIEFERTIPDSVYRGESVSIEANDENVQRRLADLGYLE